MELVGKINIHYVNFMMRLVGVLFIYDIFIIEFSMFMASSRFKENIVA